ncbi:MAG: AAA family ATPase [Chloroflexi bacterium]|nr:AAA family ATPase [Chloroflexota bacterium]
MSDIFISYVEEDADVVEPLARGLTEAGYSCWYYQRSSVPGASYLQQISDALSQAEVVLLVLSPQTLESHQVDKEISFAHECNKPFLPITHNLAWGDFQQRRPTWRLAVGTSVAIALPRDGVSALLPRVIEGLQSLSISPSAKPAAPAAGLEPSLWLRDAGASGEAVGKTPPRSRVPIPAPAVTGAGMFVGRAHELSLLQTQFDTVVAGKGGRLVFISGEAGVGKTRLAQEVGLYAWSQGGALFEGTYLRDGMAPYGPWVEALRSGLRALPPAELDALLERQAAGLGQLFPELAGPAARHLPLEASSAEERRRLLFDTLAETITALSQRAPFVLLLNDLQWAPGLAPLVHVARRLKESRALLIGTYREQEFKDQPVLVQDWAELNRTRLLTQLSLHPLNAEGCQQLVADYFGAEPARQLSDLLYRRTRGNVFFLEEVLRSLTETGAVRSGPNGWEVVDRSQVSVPESMRLVVEERVNRLGETARDVLNQAAVLGREFSFPGLQALSGRSEDELLSVLEAALAARLLVDRSVATEERYAFADDQVQEVLYAGILAPRRRRAHLRAGQTIEAVYAERLHDHVEELAHHFLTGHDVAKAWEYTLQAGERAFGLASWTRAAQHFETALALLEELPEDLPRRAQVLERLADLDTAQALPGLDHAQAALDLYTRLGEKGKAARMHRVLGLRWTSGAAGHVDADRAFAHQEAGAKLLAEEPDSADKAFAYCGSAVVLFWARLDLTRAEQRAQEALGIAGRIGDRDQLAHARTVMATVLAYQGKIGAGEAQAELGWELAQRAVDPWIRLMAVAAPLLHWPWRRDRTWTECWLNRYDELMRRAPVGRFERVVLGVAALGMALDGRPSEAVAKLEAAEAAEHRNPMFPYWTHYAGMAYTVLGDWSAARRVVAGAYDAAQRGHAALNSVEAAAFYGRFRLATGETEQADAVVSRALTDATGAGSIVQELSLLAIASELDLRLGRLPNAASKLTRAREILKVPKEWRALVAPIARVEGLLATAKCDWSAAEHTFTAALEAERAYGFLYHEAHVLVPWAELYFERNEPGDRERGLEKLNQALAIFERCEAKRDVHAVVARKTTL